MTAIDLAKANVATSAIERCLRIKRADGYCAGMAFAPRRRARDYSEVARIAAGLPFIIVMVILGIAGGWRH